MCYKETNLENQKLPFQNIKIFHLYPKFIKMRDRIVSFITISKCLIFRSSKTLYKKYKSEKYVIKKQRTKS